MLRLYPFAPQPFVFRDVRLSADKATEFAFTLRLFGPVTDLYPYVVVAVKEMLARGLGRSRLPFTLKEVHDGQKSIYREGQDGIQPPQIQIIALPASLNLLPDNDVKVGIHLTAVSPIHIRTGGEFNRRPAFLDLIRSGLRRFKLLNYFYGDHTEASPTELVALAEAVEAAREAFKPWSISRYSGRQEQKIPLQGIFVTAAYRRCDPRLGTFLQTMSQVHIGKYGSFGLGQVHVEVVKE